jgi:hypothetical protein
MRPRRLRLICSNILLRQRTRKLNSDLDQSSTAFEVGARTAFLEFQNEEWVFLFTSLHAFALCFFGFQFMYPVCVAYLYIDFV